MDKISNFSQDESNTDNENIENNKNINENGSENFDFKNIEENCNSDEYKYELCYDSNDNSNSNNKIDTNFNKNDNLSFDVEKKEVKLVDIKELKDYIFNVLECSKLDKFEHDKGKKILELCTEKFPEYSKKRLSKHIYLILNEENINAKKNCVDKLPKIDSLTEESSNEHYSTQNKTYSCEISKEQTQALSISNSSSKPQKTRLTSNSSCSENFNLKHSLSDNNNGINNFKKYKAMLPSRIEKVDENKTNKISNLNKYPESYSPLSQFESKQFSNSNNSLTSFLTSFEPNGAAQLFQPSASSTNPLYCFSNYSNYSSPNPYLNSLNDLFRSNNTLKTQSPIDFNTMPTLKSFLPKAQFKTDAVSSFNQCSTSNLAFTSNISNDNHNNENENKCIKSEYTEPLNLKRHQNNPIIKIGINNNHEYSKKTISVQLSNTSKIKSSNQLSKLNPSEIQTIKNLIRSYRESASFLSRSAEELEQLIGEI